MRRTRRIAWILGLCAASVASAGAATTPSPPPSRIVISDLAPADEYFGRQKLSVLGIRHLIFTLKDDLHRGRKRPDFVEHDADTIDDAFYDWAGRFPKDGWLARTGWELATLYEELPGGEARDRAVSLLTYVRGHCGTSPFAISSAKDLERGIGVRTWPKWAGTPPSPTPTIKPTPVPSPSASASAPVTDAPSLIAATHVLALNAKSPHAHGEDLLDQASSLERSFLALSRNGADAGYSRAAWELAALYESLPGEDARARAIRMLALVLDRYPQTIYAQWSLRDLERGVGSR
ncbi:MAG: hypothetical protein ACXWNK_03770 [Vulcanimicrobiaceae bacterium]